MNQISIIKEEVVQKIRAESTDLVSKIEIIQINTIEDYEKATKLFKIANAGVKKVKEYFKPLKDASNRAHKILLDREKEEIEKWEQPKKIIDSKITVWEKAQEKKHREEQERLQAQAKAEAEERALNEAMLAEQEGDDVAVEEILSEKIQAPIVAAPPTTPKIKGFIRRSNWKGRVVDLKALVKAIAKGEASLNLVLANQTAINQRAKADKAELKIPGVVVYEEKVSASR